MIRLGQFSSPENNSLLTIGRIGLHLRNQKAESLLSLQKRFCPQSSPGERIIFVESLLALYALGKIRFDQDSDQIEYCENY